MVEVRLYDLQGWATGSQAGPAWFSGAWCSEDNGELMFTCGLLSDGVDHHWDGHLIYHLKQNTFDSERDTIHNYRGTKIPREQMHKDITLIRMN